MLIELATWNGPLLLNIHFRLLHPLLDSKRITLYSNALPYSQALFHCQTSIVLFPLMVSMISVGGMSGGIPGGTQGKSGQERQDVSGTGAGATGNESGDTAGRQIEGARGQGLSGQGGVF